MLAKKPSAEKAKLKVVPVKELIAVHADRIGIRNPELATALGYPTHNVVSMLKSGAMRLPINKIALAADALKIDPLYLAMCVDAESDFNLAPLLESITRRTAVTLNEEKLIQKLRQVSGGFDIDLSDYPQDFETIVGIFSTVAEKEAMVHDGEVGRLKRKSRSALGSKDRKDAAAPPDSE
jgi:hypothetical protein